MPGKHTVAFTPDVSFSQGTSRLETGTGNSRNTGDTPEVERLLEDNSDEIRVEHCQKKMDKFIPVGHVDSSVQQINSSIAAEMTDQNETSFPEPELPSQNIRQGHTYKH